MFFFRLALNLSRRLDGLQVSLNFIELLFDLRSFCALRISSLLFESHLQAVQIHFFYNACQCVLAAVQRIATAPQNLH
uniref:Uncharacterized protein n=1 Tax=Anguilla anguilla TaxID=7936 RepID=A0A0E9WTW1_ANGAN